MNLSLQFLLPIMLIIVFGIVQSFYTYIYRGVFKESVLFKVLNALIASFFLYYSAYEVTKDVKYAVVLAILPSLIILIIHYFMKTKQLTVQNGPVEETMEAIEAKLRESNIPFKRIDFEQVDDFMEYEIGEGKEYIQIKYVKSWLNEGSNYTVTIKSKLKDGSTFFDEIVEQLRDLRMERSFKRRIIVELSFIFVLLAIVVYFFNNIMS